MSAESLTSIFSTPPPPPPSLLGEFPWRAQHGDTATVGNDYIAPPCMLSSEQTGQEIVWSLGEYWTGERIWKAFNLPGGRLPPWASTRISHRRTGSA